VVITGCPYSLVFRLPVSNVDAEALIYAFEQLGRSDRVTTAKVGRIPGEKVVPNSDGIVQAEQTDRNDHSEVAIIPEKYAGPLHEIGIKVSRIM